MRAVSGNGKPPSCVTTMWQLWTGGNSSSWELLLFGAASGAMSRTLRTATILIPHWLGYLPTQGRFGLRTVRRAHASQTRAGA
jgi:hypothetical protein